MSNRLEELHFQYKRYYLKMILKFLGIFVVIFSIMGVSYLLMQDKSHIQKPQVKEVVVPKVEEIKVLEESTIETIDTREAYALDVSVNELEASVAKIKAKHTPKKETKKVVRKRSEVTKKEVLKPLVTDKAKTNFFSDAQEEKSLDAWIDKYNRKRSYSAAIYIAKQYYFDKDYKQAGIWAKRANQLDRNKEEAWLFYAKSVHALGNVPKAKRILNIYLQYKKSAKADLLLSEWSE